MQRGAAVSDLAKTPRRYSRATLGLLGLLRWFGAEVWPGRAAYRWWLAHGGIEVVEVDVPLAGLPAALDGLRIVQLSDLHAGPFLDERSLEPVVDLVVALQPHLLCITGDFITHRADDVHALGSLFRRLPARLGRFAVFGNHDYRQRREGEIAALLRRQGVVVLRNASARLEHRGVAFRVAGLEDIEEGRHVDLGAALREARPDEAFTLLLCHHPDVAARLPPGRIDLALCGHTHGGQIVLPLLGCPARGWLPEHLRGLRPLSGGGWVHVNRGLGVLVLPLRLGSRAEVGCLRLRSVPSAAGQGPAVNASGGAPGRRRRPDRPAP